MRGVFRLGAQAGCLGRQDIQIVALAPRVQIAGKPQGLSLMVPGRTQAVLPEGPETPAVRPARTAKPPCCLGPLRTGLDERMLYSGRLPARSLIQRMV